MSISYGNNTILCKLSLGILISIFFTPVFGESAVASTIDKPTIVLVSMKENNDKYWPAGEGRIRDELRISNFNVVVAPTTTGEKQNFPSELESAVKRNKAVASLLVFNSGQGIIQLNVYIVDVESRFHVFKEYEFAWSPTREEIDVAALKAVDAVQATLIKMRSVPRDNWDAYFYPGQKKRRRFFKAALVFSLSAVATLAGAGVLHWRMEVQEDKANKYGREIIELHNCTSSDNPELQCLHTNFNSESKAAVGYLIGAISCYALSGTLFAIGGVLMFKYVKSGEKGPKNFSVYPTLGGFGMTKEF